MTSEHKRHAWLSAVVAMLLCTGFVFSGCSRDIQGTRDGSGGAGAGGGGTEGAGGGTPSVECEPRAVDCDGLVPLDCSEEGTWRATRAACAIDCQNGSCVGCEAGQRECRDGAVQLCDGGVWTTEEVCDVTCEDRVCVSSCTLDRRQCNGEEQLQRCDGTVYVDEQACDFLCSDGVCVGECAPDDQRCDPNENDAAQSCNRFGEWDVSTPCPTGSVCVAGDCKPCKPGSKRCEPSGTGPQSCSDAGEWVPKGSCDDPTPACLDGNCTTCLPAEKRCEDGVLEECNPEGSGWDTLEVCGGETPACLETTLACGKCSEGDIQCSNQEVQTCGDKGTWSTSTECSGSTPECVGGACRPCDPDAGQRRCQDATTAQECDDDGSWGATSDCSGDLPECRADLNFTCGCAEGDRRCRTNSLPEECVGGVWVAQSSCAAPLDHCLAATGQCVDCAGNTTSCQAGVAHQCDADGSWVSLNSCTGPGINCGGCDLGDDCGDNSDCVSGFCVNDSCAECQPNDGECTGATPRVCSSSGSWVSQPACSGSLPQCLDGTCVECLSGTQSCGSCDLGSQSCQNNDWGSCSGAPDLQSDDDHCGGCNESCQARETCQSGACMCATDSHGCGGSTPPCYANSDGAHCGSACINCGDYHGTTGACSGEACTCEGMKLPCLGSQPSCGTWDFEDGQVSGWRLGSYRADVSAATGLPSIRQLGGSSVLAVDYSTTTEAWAVTFEVDLCPDLSTINIGTFGLEWDMNVTTRTGPHSLAGIILGNSYTITSCQFVFDSDTPDSFSCGLSIPTGSSTLQVYVSLPSSELGTVYIDNIRFSE